MISYHINNLLTTIEVCFYSYQYKTIKFKKSIQTNFNLRYMTQIDNKINNYVTAYHATCS